MWVHGIIGFYALFATIGGPTLIWVLGFRLDGHRGHGFAFVLLALPFLLLGFATKAM